MEAEDTDNEAISIISIDSKDSESPPQSAASGMDVISRKLWYIQRSYATHPSDDSVDQAQSAKPMTSQTGYPLMQVCDQQFQCSLPIF